MRNVKEISSRASNSATSGGMGKKRLRKGVVRLWMGVLAGSTVLLWGAQRRGMAARISGGHRRYPYHRGSGQDAALQIMPNAMRSTDR